MVIILFGCVFMFLAFLTAKTCGCTDLIFSQQCVCECGMSAVCSDSLEVNIDHRSHKKDSLSLGVQFAGLLSTYAL